MSYGFSELRIMAGMSIEDVAREFEYSVSQVYRWERGFGAPKIAVSKALEGFASAGNKLTPIRATESPVNFRFIDLFAGIGGLRIGFQGIGGHCVFTSEWDRYAQETYARNFRDNHPVHGDIREFSNNPALIPEHDVLLAGFPCQPFSIAGVSKKNALGRPHGFLCDTQGTLFFDTAKIIKHHKPAAFVLENVKNLERHDRGQAEMPPACGRQDARRATDRGAESRRHHGHRRGRRLSGGGRAAQLRGPHHVCRELAIRADQQPVFAVAGTTSAP